MVEPISICDNETVLASSSLSQSGKDRPSRARLAFISSRKDEPPKVYARTEEILNLVGIMQASAQVMWI